MSAWRLEPLLLRLPRSVASRLRLQFYRAFGMRVGRRNRMEGGVRMRRCNQIWIGDYNAFTEGCWLWPYDADFHGIRIEIGDSNYFNRDVMIDSCGSVKIGNNNMIGPNVYITDSDHQFGQEIAPGHLSMNKGHVIIGDRCWIGAKAIIL